MDRFLVGLGLGNFIPSLSLIHYNPWWISLTLFSILIIIAGHFGSDTPRRRSQ